MIYVLMLKILLSSFKSLTNKQLEMLTSLSKNCSNYK